MEIKNITAALIKAKKQFKPVLKNAINPHYNKKYGNIESYLDATEEALLANGIFVTQVFTNRDGLDFIDTILLHESGESIKSEMHIIHGTQDPQKLGSLLTYYRRYAYAAILNLTAEDDDGEVSSKEPPKKSEPKKEETKTEKFEPVKLEKLEHYKKLISDSKLTDVKFLLFVKAARKSLDDKYPDATDYKKCQEWLDSKIADIEKTVEAQKEIDKVK